MDTHFDTELTTIVTSDLHTVIGGSNDPGNDYVSTLKKDLVMQGGHEVAAYNAAKQGNWWHAGGEALRAGVDALQTTQDAVKPLAPFWNFAKDAVSTVASLKK